MLVSGMVHYRPNVAALMVNPQGCLLICERYGVPGAWQFPQGGVDAGETLREALFREVREEIGLLPENYDVESYRGGYRYLYPEQIRLRKIRKHGGHGQEQTYFLCRVKSTAPSVNVNQKPPEFQAFRWILPVEFDLDWVPDFKRAVYREVFLDFFQMSL